MKCLLIITSIIMLWACSGVNETKDNDNAENTLENEIDEMAVYTIPSPLFIGSALKEMNCSYNSDILNDQRKVTFSGVGKILNNSLLLGLYISDFGYAFINDQQSDMNIFLAKSDELIRMLDLQSPVVTELMLRLRGNLHSKDSVRTLINELQTKISKHYLDNNNNIISIYILIGMFTEGIYLTTHACNDPDKKSISFMSANFNQILLQQKAFIINLREMLDKSGIEPDPILLNHLSKLDTCFKDLKITYSVDAKKNRIKYIHLDKTKLPAFNENVIKFRQWIKKG